MLIRLTLPAQNNPPDDGEAGYLPATRKRRGKPQREERGEAQMTGWRWFQLAVILAGAWGAWRIGKLTFAKEGKR